MDGMSNSMPYPLRECILSPTVTLRYRVYGSGPERVVLVHGLAARSETWIDLAPLFPADRYTLYLLDLLGSGESEKPGKDDYSIRAHARRLLLFLAAEKLAQITLVGHSLGGAVALLAAIEAQQQAKTSLLKSLIVMAGPGFIQRLPLIAEVFQSRLAGHIFTLLYTPDVWVKKGLRAAYYDQRLVDREHLARYAPCYRGRKAKQALVQTCRQLVPADCEEIATYYGNLRLPVLLLWGEHDRIVPLSQGIRLAEAIPSAILEVIRDCGHNPQEEKPEDTFRMIDRFVSKQELQ